MKSEKRSTHKLYWYLFTIMFFTCVYILTNIAPTHLSTFPRIAMYVGIFLLSISTSFGAMGEITKQLLEFNEYLKKAKEKQKESDITK